MGAQQMGAQCAHPQLPTIAYDCHHFATKVPFTFVAQKAIDVHKLQRVALSPHLDFPCFRNRALVKTIFEAPKCL